MASDSDGSEVFQLRSDSKCWTHIAGNVAKFISGPSKRPHAVLHQRKVDRSKSTAGNRFLASNEETMPTESDMEGVRVLEEPDMQQLKRKEDTVNLDLLYSCTASMLANNLPPAPHAVLALHSLHPLLKESAREFAQRIIHTGLYESRAITKSECPTPTRRRMQTPATAHVIVSIVIAFVGAFQVFQDFYHPDVEPGGRFHVAREEYMTFMRLPMGPDQTSRLQAGIAAPKVPARFTSPWVDAELYSSPAFLSAMEFLGYHPWAVSVTHRMFLFDGVASSTTSATAVEEGTKSLELSSEELHTI